MFFDHNEMKVESITKENLRDLQIGGNLATYL